MVSTPRVQMQQGQRLCAHPKVLDNLGVCRSAVFLALRARLGVGAVLVKIEDRLDGVWEVAHKLGGINCRVLHARARSKQPQEAGSPTRRTHQMGRIRHPAPSVGQGLSGKR